MKKHHTFEQLVEAFEAMPHNEQKETLFEAIDHMQRFNGRSKWECVFLAMGYHESDDGTYYGKAIEQQTDSAPCAPETRPPANCVNDDTDDRCEDCDCWKADRA